MRNRTDLIDKLISSATAEFSETVPDWILSLFFVRGLELTKPIHVSAAAGYVVDHSEFENSEVMVNYFKESLNLSPIQSSYDGTKSLSCYWADPNFSNFFVSTVDKKKDGEYISLRIWTLHEEKIKEFLEKTKKLKQRIRNSINAISQGQRGFELRSIGTINEKFIEENYEDDVVSSFDYLVDEFNSENPKGRFAILDGLPGTGKTYFVRSLVTQMKYSINIILPARLVREIDGPSLIDLLIKEKGNWRNYFDDDTEVPRDKSILLILEDADDCLVPRGADNMSLVSSLLNLTDGIFGSALDIRILATTNAKNTEIDPALKRTGRLCRRVGINKISAERSSLIYNRLCGKNKEYDSPMVLADIYGDAYEADTGIEVKKSSVGFNT